MTTDDNKNTTNAKQLDQDNHYVDATTSPDQGDNSVSILNNNNQDKIFFKRNSDDVPVLGSLDQRVELPSDEKSAVESIDDIRSEIEQSFSNKQDPSSNTLTPKSENTINIDGDINSGEPPLLPITPKSKTSIDTSVMENDDPLLPVTPKANPLEEKKIASTDSLSSPEPKSEIAERKDDHDALVASLKKDIESDFENQGHQENQNDNSSVGVGQTYYSDLSTAMGANDPSTMSELIKKSRFEKKQEKILSPRSKRNMFYIGAALLLLLISGGIIFTLFGERKNPIQFTSEERVSSLVFANQDTGINVTGLESQKIKQVIRNVLEKKNPKDTINQIYYVEQTPNGPVRRLGIKDIFDKTDNQTPKLLYDNIENDFTHGFYTTDKNYPFIILKNLSYDRAFEGMKEWESTMIDDLATYFDLPPEAADRSLVQDGFEDDLIRNKNVRVARYIPRETDRRGILDFLNFNRRNDQTEPAPQNNVNTTQPSSTGIITDNAVEVDQEGNIVQENSISSLIKKFAYFAHKTFTQKPVYAQTPEVTGVGFGTIANTNQSTQRICYQITKSCIDRSTGSQVPFNSGDTGQFCTDVRINNNPIPATPALEADLANYSCINTLAGDGGATGQLSAENAEPICFNNQTGERLATPDQTQFCLASYRCNLTECRANGVPVQQGSPNAQCGFESTFSVFYDDPRDKICRNYPHLIGLQNINDSAICFDDEQNYLPSNSPQTIGTGFSCIAPQSRSNQICITQNNKVAIRTGNEIFTTDRFCFQPNQNALTNIGVNDQCGNFTINQIQSRIGIVIGQLKLAALLGQTVGLSRQDVDNILEVANYLERLSLGNVLQIEEIRQTVLVLQNLEELLNIIGPMWGEESELYKLLRNIIDTVKCTLGIGNTLQWTTLAQIRIPRGFTIFAGQRVTGVEPIQQALVLMGLLDPLSVTGSLDLLTQDAISQLQLANALTVTGILDPDTLDLIQEIIDNQGSLRVGNSAIINDYFVIGDGAVDANGNIITGGAVDANGNIITGGAVDANGNPVKQILMLGAYNNSVQNLQIVLYAEEYDIDTINGLYSEQTCRAVQQFQQDNNLEIAEPVSCVVSAETLQELNDVIRRQGYLGSGFNLSSEGFLSGEGNLAGTFGPGVANFEVSEADADTLREGDVVLMYMFLDEQTILIARDQVVIDEVIERRVFSDIFEG